MIKDKCPFSAGITVRFDNVPAVRFQQESVSAFDRNCCPHSAGIGVRFAQELVSGFSKNMQVESEIYNLLNTETQLRSKKELIEKFIRENMPVITDTDDIAQEFEKFWTIEQDKAFVQLVDEEKLSKTRTQALIERFLYSEEQPMRDEILELLEGEKPTLLLRKKTGDKILARIKDFVETFINGVVG